MKNETVKSDNKVSEKVSEKVSDNELLLHLENLGLLKDLTTGEKNSYLQIAKAFNLNPFKREIHVSKYNGQMAIITGYEVYIKRAERTGQLDGWGVNTSGSIETNDLKATVTIYRKDRSHPFTWEAEYNEYVQRTKEGHVTKFWKKAHTMIKKVAISQGFRLCFSDELGGMPYTSEETPETEDAIYQEVKLESKTLPVDPVKVKEKADEEKPFEIPGNWFAKMEKCKTKADVLEIYKKNKETIDTHPELQQLLKNTQNELSQLKTA